MKKFGLLLCLSFTFSANALAQGDPEAGKTKSAACAACHGNDGNSAVDTYPKLAGQHAGYLVKQLAEFQLAGKTGGAEGRNNAIMNGMAVALTEQDMEDIAAYFSGQKATPGTTPENVVATGKQLFIGGDISRGITACAACHGPRGNGLALAKFPDISGQPAPYIKTQLMAFRAGERANDMNGMMRDIAKRLTDADIETMSQYLGGLH